MHAWRAAVPKPLRLCRSNSVIHDHTANNTAATAAASAATAAMLWSEDLPTGILKPPMVGWVYRYSTMLDSAAANGTTAAHYLSASKARRSLSRASL